jgi:hypothetical protein
MSTALSAPPLQTSLIDPPDNPRAPDAIWGITRVWNDWLLSLTTRIQQSATTLKTVSLTAQAASIATTAIPAGSLSAGLYRVSWYLRVTQAATTSSSLTVTISHTDGGVSASQSGSAATGNTTTTVQSGAFLVLSDQAASISYATTYASVGGTVMQYKLSITLEQVS